MLKGDGEKLQVINKSERRVSSSRKENDKSRGGEPRKKKRRKEKYHIMRYGRVDKRWQDN